MKRASIESRKSAINNVEGYSKDKLKFQNLLQDFLEIQKEFVSKKRKLQVLKQRKETLEDEVRFLRRRYRYLHKLQNRNLDGVEEDEGLVKERPQSNVLSIVGKRENLEPSKI